MKAYWRKKILEFKRPSGTSRGVLKTKQTYYLVIDSQGTNGIGECSPLKGLSLDDRPDYEEKLDELVNILEVKSVDTSEVRINRFLTSSNLLEWPSIRFGLEMALLDLQNGGNRILFPSNFTSQEEGIPINGLIWMGDPSFMREQVADLLSRGFRCLKMKIGAINFEDEMAILKSIRKEFAERDLILRVDANGGFSPKDAMEKLKRLADLKLHSIEQPIMAGQEQEMHDLCRNTPLPIALDEELIPVQQKEAKVKLLEQIKPQYIILKPSLVGGFQGSEEWVEAAVNFDIGWWATSALESNIGLNAISQWAYLQKAKGHQGLGTGSLYTNNIESPLEIRSESIFYNNSKTWNLDDLER